MGKNSAIQWTHHTFNPWWGCEKISPGCANCYAATFATRTGHEVWGHGAPRRFFGDAHWAEPMRWNADAERSRVIDGRAWIYAGKTQIVGKPETLRIDAALIDVPLKSRTDKDRASFTLEQWEKAPRFRPRVFCASMADVFEDREDLFEPRARLFELIEATPWLDWLLLTKRPENIARHIAEIATPMCEAWDCEGRAPENVWLGTTVEDQTRANERIHHLLRVPAAVRFLSCEPLVGPVDLDEVPMDDRCYGVLGNAPDLPPGIDWVIAGGESGPKARPMHPDWARSLRDQCAAAGVAFFFKQWGEWHPATRTDGIHECPFSGMRFDSPVSFARVGKEQAGARLDGVEHNALPR